MTQEEKQLLLKDLCARLPYGVKCQFEDNIRVIDGESSPFYDYTLSAHHLDVFMRFNNFHIKPYLRPMSSMTEEEEILFRCELPTKAKTDAQLVAMRMELFLKGHLDYNHLIEKGLALEALEWMYKEDLTMSWNFYPEDRFSSYDDYVKYLKEKGFALEAPKGVYKEN